MTRQKTGFAIHGFSLFGATVLAAFAVLAICSLAVAAIAYSSENPTAWLKTGGLISTLLTAAICGFSISKWRGEGGIGYSVLSSLSFVLIMLIIKVVANKGALSFGIFADQVCYMGVASLFAFLGRKRRRRRR